MESNNNNLGHTAAPWRLDVDKENVDAQGNWQYIIRAEGRIPESEIARLNIHVRRIPHDTCESAAPHNGALIAAAPELLHALECVLRQMDTYTINQARAAIAKAKGLDNG